MIDGLGEEATMIKALERLKAAMGKLGQLLLSALRQFCRLLLVFRVPQETELLSAGKPHCVQTAILDIIPKLSNPLIKFS